MRKKRSTLLTGLLAIGLATSGCASHLAQIEQPDYGPPGEPAAQTSVFGRAGVSTNSASGMVRCGKEGFGRVEVRRSLGQGLLSALTFGTVSPATIHFNCMPPEEVPEFVCETVVGTNEIVCTRNPDGEDGEVVTFDCEPLPGATEVNNGFACKPQSSNWQVILPWIEQAQSARG